MILDSVMIPEYSLNRETRFDESSPSCSSDIRCEELLKDSEGTNAHNILEQ
jgi:hypothetical protein